MSVVTFWNDGREQTGKTLSIAAISTYMAIEHNYRILIISTGYRDDTLNQCFWKEKKVKRNFGLFGPNTNEILEEGIVGLAKVLQGFRGETSDYDELEKTYPDIINLANSYYDLVFIDLDNEMNPSIREMILANSDLIVANISQRLTSIDRFMETRENTPILNSKKTLLLIGKYDKFSKYSIKNITRYMGEKIKYQQYHIIHYFLKLVKKQKRQIYF